MIFFLSFFFFFNDTATTEIYTLSLHDALPISGIGQAMIATVLGLGIAIPLLFANAVLKARSEEHTSELQSRLHLVCRLLLEKKKNSHPERPERHSALLCCRNAIPTLHSHHA